MNDNDGLPGLRIETASSVIAREWVREFFGKFQFVIRKDRAAGQAVSAAFIDALSGATALVIAGGHASKEDAIYQTVRAFKDAVERDLKHYRPN